MKTTQMMFKVARAALACGVLATAARGAVMFLWEPTTIDVGVPTEITMSMMTNPGYGPSGTGFVAVDFTPTDPQLTLSDGEWLGAFAVWDPTTYYGYNSLTQIPEPFYAAYGGVGGLVVINDHTPTPTFKVTATSNELGSFFLDTAGPGMPLYAEEGTWMIPIKEGIRVKIDVVPEPASLGLLAFGGLVLLRRR